MTIQQNVTKVIRKGAVKGSSVWTNEEFTALGKEINPNLFTKKRTRKDFTRANLELVGIQTSINKQLRAKGMVIKSRNYSEEFYVVRNKSALKEVDRYFVIAENAKEHANVLSIGISKLKRNRK